MLRQVVGLLVLGWIVMMSLTTIVMMAAPQMPSRGTVVLTHNQFLSQQERFEIVDLSRTVGHRFTPAITEDARFASLAPDNRRLATVTIDEGIFTLRIQALDGRDLIAPFQLNRSEQMRLGNWSQDGRYLIYYVTRAVGTSQTHILDSRTGEATVIDNGEMFVATASLSPDNSHVTFAATDDAATPLRIWVGDWRTQQYELVTSADSEVSLYCPAWSPDGTQLIYWESLDYGSEQLMVMNVDGSGVRALSEHVWRITTCPYWSHDEQHITFVSVPSFSREGEVIILNVPRDDYATVLRVEETSQIRWSR